MDRPSFISELKFIIEGYLRKRGLVLVELIYRHEGSKLILCVLADKPEGGISLKDCAKINSDIGLILDEKDIIKEKYLLEVSSPGLDRPLRTKDDFLRCVNKRARFFFLEPVGGKLELEGIISRAEDDTVYLDIEGACIEVPLSKINKAKQVF